MEYGFEREFFLRKRGEGLVAVPGALRVYTDGSGVLVEARGAPHTNPILAVFSYRGAEFLLKRAVRKAKHSVIHEASFLVPLAVQRRARRSFAKGPDEYQNLYGLDYALSKTDDEGGKWFRAGLHIHFSRTKKVEGRHGLIDVPDPLDMVQIIRTLDGQFETEIADTDRVPGMYEMKPYGFEYRSLPADMDLTVVADFLDSDKVFKG
jgi:hypothetical protein